MGDHDLSAIINQNIDRLPSLMYLRIRDHWDSFRNAFREFVSKLDGDFEMTQEKVNYFESKPSPATELWQALSAKDMTLQQFTHYVILSEDHNVISYLNVDVPIRITDNPPEQVDLLGGESLTLNVRAFGHPRPNYQWFKDNHPLEGENHCVLEISQTSFEHAGSYFCRVYNQERRLESMRTKVNVDLIIKEQPKSCAVDFGDRTKFTCKVLTCTNSRDLRYAWFKNDEPLTDSSFIQGSNTERLVLQNIQMNMTGFYHCKVFNTKGQCVVSGSAQLQIRQVLEEFQQRNNTKYTAVDKVALLIGCGDYRGNSLLQAPRNDVKTLSMIFQGLGFKVVSLINLTKAEINSAVDVFKNLVSEGVYCVFYFCGHGFETSGQRILVPVDAPMQFKCADCVVAENIRDILLNRDPTLCCMILDCCRELKAKSTGAVPEPQMEAVKKGNLIVFYATSFGLNAYEGKKGILVSLLKNYLSTPMTIENVFSKVREKIPDIKELKKQIPEISANLSEPQRSLADPIVYSGYTDEFNKRYSAWYSGHRKPDSIELAFQFEDFEVNVQVDFQQEFSNVLKVFVSVVSAPSQLEECLAYVSSMSEEVAERPKIRCVPGTSKTLRQTFITIQNIQKIKSDLVIEVTVTCRKRNSDTRFTSSIKENLERPLVANLDL